MVSPAVIKFGGSLLGSPERDGLLAAAARRGAIVAPGGGPFADAVREAQRRYGFGDAAAHAMAILAMDQTAHLLRDVAPEFDLCASPADFDATTHAGRPAIWRPSAMAPAADLPASWDVTSDSLALWLAIQVGAPLLVMLKSAAVTAGQSPEQWAAAGIVDPAFPDLASTYQGEIALLGKAKEAALEALLATSERRAA